MIFRENVLLDPVFDRRILLTDMLRGTWLNDGSVVEHTNWKPFPFIYVTSLFANSFFLNLDIYQIILIQGLLIEFLSFVIDFDFQFYYKYTEN